MIYKFLPFFMLFFMSFSTKTEVANTASFAKDETVSLAAKIEMVYYSLDRNNLELPQITCFQKAMEGYYSLRAKGVVQKEILTVIDFSLSSAKKRMWVIDLNSNEILIHTFVSHGMNSGGEYANKFSNATNSNQSSLGFYTTGEVYNGKHGISLKLDGQERGINSNARSRALVIHGAYYANPSVIRSQGYLGRSQGCPAIPEAVKKQVIKTIKNKSCIFIYHPSKSYEIASRLVS